MFRTLLVALAGMALLGNCPAMAQYDPSQQQQWQQQQMQPQGQYPPQGYAPQGQYPPQGQPYAAPQQSYYPQQAPGGQYPQQAQGQQSTFYGQAAENQMAQPEQLPPGGYLQQNQTAQVQQPQQAQFTSNPPAADNPNPDLQGKVHKNHDGLKNALGSVGKTLGKGLGVAAPLAGAYMLTRGAGGMGMGGMGMGGMMSPYGMGMGYPSYGYGYPGMGYGYPMNNGLMGGGMMNPAAGITNLLLNR
jgi:hypothetical protein